MRDCLRVRGLLGFRLDTQGHFTRYGVAVAKAKQPAANKAKQPKSKRLACSFCDRPWGRNHTTLWRRRRPASAGPRICEACVWTAAQILNADLEEQACVVYVATSELHERGAFSGQYVRKGQYVGTYVGPDDGPITRRNERYVMYYHDESGDVEGWRAGANEFRFLNHSDDPNLEMDENFHFWALRHIKKDEELTWYYGDEYSKELQKKLRKKIRK